MGRPDRGQEWPDRGGLGRPNDPGPGTRGTPEPRPRRRSRSPAARRPQAGRVERGCPRARRQPLRRAAAAPPLPLSRPLLLRLQRRVPERRRERRRTFAAAAHGLGAVRRAAGLSVARCGLAGEAANALNAIAAVAGGRLWVVVVVAESRTVPRVTREWPLAGVAGVAPPSERDLVATALVGCASRPGDIYWVGRGASSHSWIHAGVTVVVCAYRMYRRRSVRTETAWHARLRGRRRRRTHTHTVAAVQIQYKQTQRDQKKRSSDFPPAAPLTARRARASPAAPRRAR